MARPTTLGELRAAGAATRPVKQELRDNLLAKLERGEELFPTLVGFDDSVLPALERGILADSSTTSLNLQPSLLMPPEALDVALGIVADAVDETIAGEGPR